jgi:CPA2 family monovalent cation:H+ antiporter-2
MRFVARQHSGELFMLTVLLLIFGAAGGAALAHLSLPLGAFLAGMVLGETEFKHQIEADIRPFQDVLLGLFFITVGMQLDPAILWTQGSTIAALLLLVLLGKTLIVAGLGWLLGYHPGVALRAGLCLGQVGEFGLLLITLSLQAGLLSVATGQIVLAVMIVSMTLAPVLVRWNGYWIKRLSVIGYQDYLAQQQSVMQFSQTLTDHVLLCGYGRVGQNLARLLELEEVPYLALDLDAERVRHAQVADAPVVYGDAARLALLKAAGIERARALVITLGEPHTSLKVLQQARHLRYDLPILVRGTDAHDLQRLLDAGATVVMPETLEASLLLGAQLLAQLEVPRERIDAYMDTARADRYELLRALLPGTNRAGLHHPPSLRAVPLPDGSLWLGQPIAALDLASFGVRVLSLRRGGGQQPQPDPATLLQPEDVLVLYGTRANLDAAERQLRNPPD